MNVAYLGPVGTYSEEAARQHGGPDDTYLPFATIDEAVEAAQSGTADIAVVPVENSTEGSVSRTLDLLVKTSLSVVSEVFLPIHHQLLASGEDMQLITEVRAHPQALAQCRTWLTENLPKAKRVSSASNAQAAAEAAKESGVAAIAGTRAADIYKLHILASNIEDVSDNTTRFLVLGQQDTQPTGKDRTSFVCTVPNEPGTLYALLGILAKRGLNMTKLESRPSTEATWDYIFFIDIDGHRDEPAIKAALAEVDASTVFLKIFGSYPKAQLQK